ncbi:ATP-dependent DNA helicase RecG [Nitrospirillum pindoramense]|uniref:ATP-dependent DNA helicase RecG n=1 Tax=Nitrospirillum amazonense TaxID=28077 RepID=A0A560H2F9_9PROT|nr:ATP-dependent DNA helicase RecG [Nitrospirillum amazonense]TWB40486.1 ATP-dependent DNA helicase RecG [Nitrospirillum amazonense]
MRPPVLYPLFAPITSLPGLGPRLGKLAERLTGPHVADILWHLPTGVLDRANAPSISEAPEGRIVTLTVRVDGHMPPVQRHRPYRVRCTDHTGEMELVFFHVKGDWLEKKLPQGTMVVVSGKVERFNGLLQMPHPDHFAPVEEGAPPQEVEAVYPLTGGLNPKPLRTAIQAALARTPELEEWQDPAWLERQGWPAWKAALTAAHDPQGEKDVNPLSPLRQRLAYDELLANQLALALVRWHQRRLAGRATVGDGRLRARIQAALPYQLTGAQAQALVEIDADMGKAERMLRLLQGDVGSGKTIVALMAMATAVEAGAQAALMAPTEILARQHAESLADLADAAGIRLALLTGRDKGKARQQVLDRLASGEIDILIGTHALFQEDVAFRDLALAIIDEQHKFGVHQRLALAAKGRGVDTLVMTATPIPRTLTLTAYGDMDVSRLMEKPPGRKPVVTRAAAADRIEEVVERVAAAIKTGQRVYWVCPLVDESETVDLANATLRHATLMERLGGCVGLVHGKMKGTEKDAVMARFAAGELSVLVATTVIEVGVNVPEATIMVVEHAERFGLAQLHQLRGRVGRGDRASACLLLYTAPLGETARARLDVMTSTEDGFLIAEKDLELRGAGEVLGTRQSGLPEFRMADITVHADLLATARDDASLMVARDPDLETPRGQALRVLLYLFQRDEAVRTLRSG